jgi:hypothetical protein
MALSDWKPNWLETRQHFLDWWQHTGLVLTVHNLLASVPHEVLGDPGEASNPTFFYTQPAWRVQHNHARAARQQFLCDNLPMTGVDTGPGSLALYLGSEPGFAWDTVWFHPCILGEQPEQHPPLCFDPSNRWWQLAEAALRGSVLQASGRYLVGCPDLVENIDILAALRDPQTLLMDMIERPGWVAEKVEEINQAWFEAYKRIHAIIQLEDGHGMRGSAFAAFGLWAPGTVAKVQCDACAMFSPRMFRRFVLPALRAQCDWLDYSLYHLDGHQCIPHLDALLEIDSLDAIEWTPDPQVPGGGSPRWYELYRRILAAGKSVQAVGVSVAELEPLLDAVGPAGLYVMVGADTHAKVEQVQRIAERFRI